MNARDHESLKIVAKLRDVLRVAIVDGITPGVYLEFQDHLDVALQIVENLDLLRIVRDTAKAFRNTLKGNDSTLALRRITSTLASIVNHACLPFTETRREQLQTIIALPALASNAVSDYERRKLNARLYKARENVVDHDFCWIIDQVESTCGMESDMAVKQLHQCIQILGWCHDVLIRTVPITELQSASFDHQTKILRWIISILDR
ncbi:MAG: hypothetical protein KDA87_12650, partial [Planctomycetales bacterium]|nr:hypothetical protein [Planctomycetales bacterium]